MTEDEFYNVLSDPSIPQDLRPNNLCSTLRKAEFDYGFTLHFGTCAETVNQIQVLKYYLEERAHTFQIQTRYQ